MTYLKKLKRFLILKFKYLVIFTILTCSFFIEAEEIPVFSPHIKTNIKFQEKIKNQIEKNGDKALVFSKYEDFIKYTRELNSKVFFQQLPENLKNDNTVKYQFVGGEKIELKSISLKKKGLEKFSTLKIGIVQFDESENLKKIIEKQLKNKVKVLRTVSKEEDLIPLLIFKTVDIIFIDARSLKFIKERFNLKLQEQKWKITLNGEAIITRIKK